MVLDWQKTRENCGPLEYIQHYDSTNHLGTSFSPESRPVGRSRFLSVSGERECRRLFPQMNLPGSYSTALMFFEAEIGRTDSLYSFLTMTRRLTVVLNGSDMKSLRRREHVNRVFRALPNSTYF